MKTLKMRLTPLLHRLFVRLLFPLGLLLIAGPSLAEKADREKAVDLEADKVSVDDIKKTLVFEGNVLLTQGTLSIRASRLVVVQDKAGFQKGTAYGNPAIFRQKREGRDDFIEGEAARIEHDARTEKTEFFVQARVRSGGDEVTGNFISFDGVTERYLVTGNPAKPGTPAENRVRATLLPKNKNPVEQKSK